MSCGGVEWNWYTQNQSFIYWNSSPNYQWIINLKVSGSYEVVTLYVLASSSPKFPVLWMSIIMEWQEMDIFAVTLLHIVFLFIRSE